MIVSTTGGTATKGVTPFILEHEPKSLTGFELLVFFATATDPPTVRDLGVQVMRVTLLLRPTEVLTLTPKKLWIGGVLGSKGVSRTHPHLITRWWGCVLGRSPGRPKDDRVELPGFWRQQPTNEECFPLTLSCRQTWRESDHFCF